MQVSEFHAEFKPLTIQIKVETQGELDSLLKMSLLNETIPNLFSWPNDKENIQGLLEDLARVLVSYK